MLLSISVRVFENGSEREVAVVTSVAASRAIVRLYGMKVNHSTYETPNGWITVIGGSHDWGE